MSSQFNGLFERILAQNNQSEPTFHFDSYWYRWSRILLNKHNQIIEVNLTPVPGAFHSTWERDVQPFIFRHFKSPIRLGDRVVSELPSEIYELMLERLGEVCTKRLLTEDWLSQISLNLLCSTNVGKSFQRIRKSTFSQR